MNGQKIIRLVLISVAAVLCVVTLLMVFSKSNKVVDGGASLGLTIMLILAGIAVLGTIALAIKNLANNPKGAIRVGIGLVVMLVIFFIGKARDAGELYPQDPELTEGGSKTVGGLLTVMYALGVVSAIAFLGALIMSVIKK